MRPTSVILSAVGASAWIPVQWLAAPMSVGLGCIPSSNATLTYSVQHTFDTQEFRPVGLSQTATTITVTDQGAPTTGGAVAPGHGLSVADSVIITRSGMGIDGAYAVASVTNQTTYTLTSAISQTASNSGATPPLLQSFRVFNHVSLNAQSTRMDGNYAFGVQAVRLNVTALSAGYMTLMVYNASWG